MSNFRRRPMASSLLSRNGRHHPYFRELGTPPIEDHPTSKPLVAFEDLKVGQFYNCAISFTPLVGGGGVPNSLPKHRILLARVVPRASTVEVFYLTTFGGKTPSKFYSTEDIARYMYIPIGTTAIENQLDAYLGFESEPPAMKGWLNFGSTYTIAYTNETPDRMRIRYAPESVQVVNPPLQISDHSAITAPSWAFKYIQEMKNNWGATIDAQLPADTWWEAVRMLKERFEVLRQEESEEMANDGEEWLGIGDADLEGLADTDNLDGSSDPMDISRDISHRFTTTPKTCFEQLAGGGMYGLATLHRSKYHYQDGASMSTGHGESMKIEAGQDELDYGNEQHRYKAVAVFWEIGTEEEESKEEVADFDDDMWIKVLHGRPKAML